MLIYLLGYSFPDKFGCVTEVGYRSIVLESVSGKTSFLKQGCDICSLQAGPETALLY